MAEYIDREAVVTGILSDLEPLICRDPASAQVFSALPDKKIISYLENFPVADVRPVDEISETVEEAIRVLNAINSSGRMDYGDYCELHDVICDICPACGADNRGGDAK